MGTRIVKSIVYDEDGRLYPEGGVNPADSWGCLLLFDPAAAPGVVYAISGDPRWVDPGARNYRLQDSSPALDVCHNAEPSLTRDRDGNDRGVDHLGKANELGTFDLGAFEYQPTP